MSLLQPSCHLMHEVIPSKKDLHNYLVLRVVSNFLFCSTTFVREIMKCTPFNIKIKSNI